MEEVLDSPFEFSDRREGVSTTSSSGDDESKLEVSVLDDEEDKSHGTGTTRGTKQSLYQSKLFSRGMIVLCIMTFMGLALGSSTYFLLLASQQKEFETEFESFAREAADIAENNAENAFGQFRTLATAITSAAIDGQKGYDFVPDLTDTSDYYNGTENVFPNVTIAHFDLRAQEISKLTGAEMIMFVPFVEQADLTAWENYSTENQWWIEQDYGYRGWDLAAVEPVAKKLYSLPWFDDLNDTRRGYMNEDGFMNDILLERNYDSENLSAPVAQYGPGLLNTSLAKLDLFAHQIFKKEIVASLEYDVPVISEPTNLDFLLDYLESPPNSSSLNRELLRSFTLDQVKEDFHEDSKTVGYLVGVLPWSTFFSNLLPENVNGIVVEIVSDCGSAFTYTINGARADVESMGSYNNSRYQGMEMEFRFFWKEHAKGRSRHCHFDLVLHPSAEFENAYKNNTPLILGVIVFISFVGLGIFFFVFSAIMARRQYKVQMQVKQVEAIVTSVFPKSIGERLIAEATDSDLTSDGGSTKKNLGHRPEHHRSKPLADLFLNTTVVFADIVGFTAWSSMREPSQVFILLETIYRDFDKITQRRGVYKVETVGDCYVAVAGLPKPRHDHFIAAAHFAGDVLSRMGVLTSQIECELGPDTADLGIRIGIHSGPVTAGVLRGERARFQLFGDTVNTAARMETTGQKNRIQISQQTADLLGGVGKGHWFVPREDKVMAKGKGELQTYWLDRINGAVSSSAVSINSKSSSRGKKIHSSSALFRSSFVDAPHSKKIERLINWNVEVLSSLLKQIEERRRLTGTAKALNNDAEKKLARLEQELLSGEDDKTVIDEVVESINLPRFKADQEADNVPFVALSPAVCSQLRDYVTAVANVYEDNSFHNFEHASHVTMSVVKLLGRIVAPKSILSDDARELHDHTYGITSDPLTQFAVVFSAMLHDADHPGVSNVQLVKEQTEDAIIYKNTSVAEQHSIDLCWNMLMQDQFLDLRRAIYKTGADLQRFRNLVVNAVMATDIMDPSLKKLRNDRWDRAFSKYQGNKNLAELEIEQTNRKATVVIEHLIQASDVSHTMQHWAVYRKWNSRLFMETYVAFLKGRSATDPSTSWYKGEIGFFDFYIIPLAKKLDECGVFGVSSHEYLNYAEENRAEWERKGETIVSELKAQAAARFKSEDIIFE